MNDDCFEDDIDLYEDLDKIELGCEVSNQDDASQKPFAICQSDFELGYSDTNGINKVINIQDQTSDDLALYSELLYSDIKKKHEREKKEKEECISMKKENADLKQSQQLLQAEIKRLTTENDILKRNMSSLYKTAKEEINFKTELITELRDELNEYIFRRRARPYNVPYKQSIRNAKYKSREMVECDTTTEHELNVQKLHDGFKSFGHNFSHGIANADNTTTKRSSRDISEVKNDNKDTLMGHEALKDIESIIETVLHKFVNESETLELGHSNEKQVGLSNLKKILLAMGKNSGVNSNTIMKRDCRKGPQQGKSCTKTYLGKRHNNNEVEHQPSFKKSCVSHSKKTLPYVQSYHDSVSAVNKPLEKFSNSQKLDVFKLYSYHNMDVPYAVKRRLGIPLAKNNSKLTIQNTSSKLNLTSLRKPSNKIYTIPNSTPEINSVNNQSNSRNAQKLDPSFRSKLTLSKESNNIAVVKPIQSDSLKTSLINRQPNLETDFLCKITDFVTAPGCNRSLPNLITSASEETGMKNGIENTNSERRTEIDFNDIIDFGLQALTDSNPERGSEAVKETPDFTILLHKMEPKLNDKEACVPSKEPCISENQKLEIDFSDIIDFGLKKLDDSTTKKRKGAKKKKSRSISLYKKEHKSTKRKSTK